MAAQPDDNLVKLPRIALDPRVPVVWLASGAVAVAGGLVSMYFKLDNVDQSVTQLKVEVRTANDKTIEFAKDQAVMEFRLRKLEQERVQKDRQ